MNWLSILRAVPEETFSSVCRAHCASCKLITPFLSVSYLANLSRNSANLKLKHKIQAIKFFWQKLMLLIFLIAQRYWRIVLLFWILSSYVISYNSSGRLILFSICVHNGYESLTAVEKQKLLILKHVFIVCFCIDLSILILKMQLNVDAGMRTCVLLLWFVLHSWELTLWIVRIEC